MRAVVTSTLVGVVLAGCVTPARDSKPEVEGSEPSVATVRPAEAPPKDAARLDSSGSYLRPNTRLPDGTMAFVHVAEADMPWRVAIGYPTSSPMYGSRARAREVAIEAMRMWEQAIQPHVPWFRLEFIEEDPAAAVQIKWKRRITGPWAGFGRSSYELVDGELHVGGVLEISTTPDNFITLSIDEVRVSWSHTSSATFSALATASSATRP